MASPYEACRPLRVDNTANYTGRIVVATRGNCSFVEKALYAQRAGAAAIIIVNVGLRSNVGEWSGGR